MAKNTRTRSRRRTRSPEERELDKITFTQDLYYLSMRGYAQDFKRVDIRPAVVEFLRDAPLNELQSVMVDLLLAIRDRTPPESPPAVPAVWITTVPTRTPRKTSGDKTLGRKRRPRKSPARKAPARKRPPAQGVSDRRDGRAGTRCRRNDSRVCPDVIGIPNDRRNHVGVMLFFAPVTCGRNAICTQIPPATRAGPTATVSSPPLTRTCHRSEGQGLRHPVPKLLAPLKSVQ